MNKKFIAGAVFLAYEEAKKAIKTRAEVLNREKKSPLISLKGGSAM